MKKIYVCSAYASLGDRAKNLEKAKEYCLEIINNGNIPIAPHVFYTQMLNDDDPKQRAAGLRLGMELLMQCDVVEVYGCISDGMRNEIIQAVHAGIPVNYGEAEDLNDIWSTLHQALEDKSAGVQSPLSKMIGGQQEWQKA